MQESVNYKKKRFSIGELSISAVNMDKVLRLVDERIKSGRSTYICLANVRVTIISQKDEEFARIQNESYLTLPDGMPLVWYARLAGYREVERITGPDLMMKLLELSGEKGYTHYFYGDTEQTLSKMLNVIQERYPDTNILETYSPPFRPLSDDEVRDSIQKVNRLKPTFLWVALGAPKQEHLIARMMKYVENSIVIGVGAAFRFLVGEYKHPPAVIQKCGLEGICWRFMKNPTKEAGWYLYHVPAFGKLLVAMLVRRAFGGRT